jgi:hypothetical protein
MTNTKLNRWIHTEFFGLPLKMDMHVYNYSGSISAAWEVFEKLAADYSVGTPEYSTAYWRIESGSIGLYYCEQIFEDDYCNHFSPILITAKSPAYAVCLAAYKAKTGRNWGDDTQELDDK